MSSPHEIGDDELILRKIPINLSWYNPSRNEIAPDAFKPTQYDGDGISFDRAQSQQHPEFRSIEEAAQGPSSNGYYVSVLRVGDLRAHGYTVVPDPLPDSPGHALVVDLTYLNRKDPLSQEKMILLAHQLVLRVEGPFLSASN